MKRAVSAMAVLAALWSGTRVAGQRAASTTLVVRVSPEAHLNPPGFALRFRLPAEPAQVASFSAWVRARTGERIGVTGVLRSLSGPAGPVPSSALRWSASRAEASGGGRAAECAGGSFASGARQELVSGWNRSGTLACTLVFSLAEELPPGEYSGSVDLVFSEPRR